jgi:restriction system protein
MPRLLYQIEIRHSGLHEYKVVRGASSSEVNQKADAQIAKWNQRWQRQLERETTALSKEAKKELAALRTEEAMQYLREVENLLISSLSTRHVIDWKLLLQLEPFSEPTPTVPQKPLPTPQPKPSDEAFRPRLSVLDRLFSSLAKRKQSRMKEAYSRAVDFCREEKDRRSEAFRNEVENYNREAAQWNEHAKSFRATQKRHNEQIESLSSAYTSGTPEAVVSYCELVLSSSIYPESFPRSCELDYRSETKVLVVSFSLPVLENLPKVREVKYVATRNELVESFLSDSALNKLYDDTIYKIALRTINELFDADVQQSLESVVFNGFVDSVDKSTGKEAHACILSLQANREEFEGINLRQVDAKFCFRKLKGVGSSQLHSLTPIAPIVDISRDDKRFITSYEVAIDNSQNLAAMDWEDFEHLVRQLFEEEFRQTGGEVKVTQASRDGGVDAVVFDPDPIRGGKIIIQAKRYTNVVGVAAVRDLYGTIVNEGANKGILVTTSQYGPDAYAFAKDKPITLLDGSNLLHLLQKHGHRARIDLKEAKSIFAEANHRYGN